MIVINKKTGKKQDIRLPKRFKAKWITALRSGEYKQGSIYLHDKEENTYCCLGVACRIIDPKIDMQHSGLIVEDVKIFKDLKVPNILKGYEDLDSKEYNPVVDRLVTMNDGGRSFKLIANWIDKNL